MQEMDGSSWKRQGCSIVWSPDLLGPLLREADAVPLRTVVGWLDAGLPESPPGDRRTVLVWGLQTVLTILPDAESRYQWLRQHILPLNRTFASQWDRVGLVFGMDGPTRLFTPNEADGVGLGKTIEIALILRELASRGEMTRALMAVPAGLVNNWRRELNETFHLAQAERCFYDALMDYLRDGYNLAQSSGQQGRALIREMFDLTNDPIGRAEADRTLADAKVRLLRKLGEALPTERMESEIEAAADEESAATLVSVALPAERRRILDLLSLIPRVEESKTLELLRALVDLWAVHPGEKIVVFTTYLGSVDALKSAIDRGFPQAGVEVLKGGDHGAKLAAERRFKRADGPRVLVCTAAGRLSGLTITCRAFSRSSTLSLSPAAVPNWSVLPSQR